ncbi:potassium channel family protein [Mycobacterium angelicum]|uniref:Ion transporter n=1 Tax=Mycobacterium angelicum TaxID=470074 RepID=A0A1W9ZK77_MYCAN|nr:potassium channel family protein [Mycobacterium angelicum]MCV7195917.1 two pore domain potassium channel family protein [Mycobacterium angelicum]ORA16952.1 ion transporter [Mycobacterium angelicum]
MAKKTKEQLWEQRTEWPLALVAIVLLVMYSVQVLTRPLGEEARILWMASWAAWSLFVIDYFVRLSLASDRRQWILLHLFDLLIVALPLMRPLRLLRLVVLVGVLQKAIGNAVRGRILTYTISAVMLLIYVASLAILDTERDQPGATINTFGQAVWWSICTVTTIGYGHLYPVTVAGRVVAVLLMVGGITLVGVVTASLASWIVQRVSETDTENQAATAFEIDELRREIRSLAEQLRVQGSVQNA